MNAIDIRNVFKSYPEFTMQDVTLQLPEGMILGLIGENGSGKTTLIKLIMGMCKKDAGAIEVLGCSDLAGNPAMKEEIGVVPDEVFLPPFMKAEEIGVLAAKFYRSWDAARYRELLDMLRIPLKTPFKDLSKGNKMRCGFACALSHRPKLLILDEATAGLDPIVRDEILDLLTDFTRQEDHSILISSHIVSDLERVCDYVTFLHEGSVLLTQEKDLLKEECRKIVCSVRELSAIPQEALVGKRETPYGAECIVRKWGVPEGVNASPVSLEEIYVMMVKGEAHERAAI
ncbi:MAG: ABC transporter ATP-binding protein [Lachnospiraceae bacterium]|nr:ABC transporter ATP-binding protein [Lachnospiraceae bacterium]